MSLPPEDLLRRPPPTRAEGRAAAHDDENGERVGGGERQSATPSDAASNATSATAPAGTASSSFSNRGRADLRRGVAGVYRWLRANSFTPAWMPHALRRPGLGYLVAALAQVVAVAVTTILDRAFADFSVSGLLPALVIVLVALTFGAGPSLFATLVGVPLIDYFLLPPYDRFTMVGPGSTIGMGLLLAVGITISVVASRIETQRRHARDLAFEREAVLEAVPDGLIVFDEYRRLVRVNPAARRLLALDGHEEYLTQPSAKRGERLAGRDLAGVPIPLEHWPVNRVLRGETLKGADSVDTIIEALDGHETLVNISGAPVRDAEGRLVGAAIVLHDLREQRQLERRTHEALAALLAMAEVLVSSEAGESPEESYAAGPVARRLAELTCSVLGCRRVAITAVNPETEIMRAIAVAGLSPEQERQWWSEQTEGASLADSPDQHLVARLRSGEVVTLDMTQPPYDDQPNPWEIRDLLVAPMRMGELLVGLLTLDYGGVPHTYTAGEMVLAGTVAKLVGLVVERERLFHQREEARAHALALGTANQRMNEFLGVASHELKTPVTSLKVNVQLGARWLAKLERTAAQVDERFAREVAPVRELLDRSDRTMVRLTRLVDDLLDVSRIRAGKLELRREPGDLVTIVRDAVAEQRALASEAGPDRAISLDLGGLESVPVEADADRIGQVVTNYLTNALKYSPHDAPIYARIEVQRVPPASEGGSEEGRVARVSVRDHGPGLNAEELEQIWEPFHRAQGVEVLSGSGVGLGLGLYISRTIIERHGGEVGVTSAPGEGSTFWFTLPLNAPSL